MKMAASVPADQVSRGAARPVLVLHRPAAAALAAHVDSIWFASRAALPHRRERSLPTGRVDIVVPLLQDSVVRFASVDDAEALHFRGAVVSGAHDRFAVRGMGGASAVIGVHFKAAGAAAFLGGALGELRNRTVLLDALWGPVARDWRERLQGAPSLAERFRIVELALLARMQAPSPIDGAVAQALRGIERDPSTARIDALQRASMCSPQRFIHRFEAAVGMTPKRFARVARFNAMLRRLVQCGKPDWAGLAAEAGYCDQSHLIAEFKRLAGVTPSVYAPMHAHQPTHVPIIEP